MRGVAASGRNHGIKSPKPAAFGFWVFSPPWGPEIPRAGGTAGAQGPPGPCLKPGFDVRELKKRVREASSVPAEERVCARSRSHRPPKGPLLEHGAAPPGKGGCSQILEKSHFAKGPEKKKTWFSESRPFREARRSRSDHFPPCCLRLLSQNSYIERAEKADLTPFRPSECPVFDVE